jgi:hypothetical protein
MSLWKRLKNAVVGGDERQAGRARRQRSTLHRQVMAMLAPGSPDPDRIKLAGVVAWLEQIPSGIDDLKLVVEKGITLSFNTGDAGAGAFRKRLNTVVLSRLRSDAGTVATLVHELTHAREFHAGRAADINTQTKKAYARAMVREESKTYFHEVVIARELIHLTRRKELEVWRQFLTEHTVQMWFQLVHGVPYQRRPSDEVLAADAALTVPELLVHYAIVFPRFEAYVEAYFPYECAKWDMVRGNIRPLPPLEMSELLSTSFGNLPLAVLRPMR